jgi:hypothetical protein
MDMRENENINARVLNASLLESHQRRRSKFDGISQTLNIDHKTGIEPPAAPEGVTATGEGNFC